MRGASPLRYGHADRSSRSATPTGRRGATSDDHGEWDGYGRADDGYDYGHEYGAADRDFYADPHPVADLRSQEEFHVEFGPTRRRRSRYAMIGGQRGHAILAAVATAGALILPLGVWMKWPAPQPVAEDSPRPSVDNNGTGSSPDMGGMAGGSPEASTMPSPMAGATTVPTMPGATRTPSRTPSRTVAGTPSRTPSRTPSATPTPSPSASASAPPG